MIFENNIENPACVTHPQYSIYQSQQYFSLPHNHHNWSARRATPTNSEKLNNMLTIKTSQATKNKNNINKKSKFIYTYNTIYCVSWSFTNFAIFHYRISRLQGIGQGNNNIRCVRLTGSTSICNGVWYLGSIGLWDRFPLYSLTGVMGLLAALSLSQ